MNLFPYKETYFFGFIQFPSFIAQLCNLVAHPVGYLCQELHTLLEVVVPCFDQSVALLNSERRQGEITALLDLLDELAPSATAGLQGQIQMLSKQIRLALPHT